MGFRYTVPVIKFRAACAQTGLLSAPLKFPRLPSGVIASGVGGGKRICRYVCGGESKTEFWEAGRMSEGRRAI